MTAKDTAPLYVVTCINGYRSVRLNWEAAQAKARRMQEEMKRMGWRGKARILCLDGTEIPVERG